MSRIGRSGAAVVILSAAVVAHGPHAAQAQPSGLAAQICDELGPDTFVYGNSPRTYAGREPAIAWVDVIQNDLMATLRETLRPYARLAASG